MHQAIGRVPWGRVAAALLVTLLVVGCGGKKTLRGKTIKVDGRESAAIKELIEKAVGLAKGGKDRALMSLLKKDLPKAGQATILNTLKKLAEADGWDLQGVERFGDAYFRATLKLEGGAGGAVTVNVLEDGKRYVLTGGG